MSDYGEPDLNDEVDECEIHKYAPLPCKDCRIAELEAAIKDEIDRSPVINTDHPLYKALGDKI